MTAMAGRSAARHRDSPSGADRYTIENLVIETAPRVFLTANLYLPAAARGRIPSVLYQCGHASKSVYARHGAWFAAHGIAALVMDNIEMGEVEFTHHGVYCAMLVPLVQPRLLAPRRRTAERAAGRGLSGLPPRPRSRAHRRHRTLGRWHDDILSRALDERIKASAPVSGTLSTNGLGQAALELRALRLPVSRQHLWPALLRDRRHDRPACATAVPTPTPIRGFPMDAFTELVGQDEGGVSPV